MKKIVFICVVLGIVVFTFSMVLNIDNFNVFMDGIVMNDYNHDIDTFAVEVYSIRSQLYMIFHLVLFEKPSKSFLPNTFQSFDNCVRLLHLSIFNYYG